MVLVRGSLLAICLGLSSALGAQQKRGFLDDFDVECLRTMMEDDAAREALSKLKSVTVDSELDPENLLDFQALELSEHVSCVTYSSAKCGEVVVLPPREQASETVQAISDEIEAMSDEQVLRAVNYDLNGLCAAVSEVEAALEPHKQCLETNMEAFAGLPSTARKMVIELLTGSVDPNNPNPWDFDFSSALQFTEGCDSFKASVASSIRSQLSSESWSNLLTQVYSAYDGESFDARVSADIGGDSTALYGCTVAPELICTKLASVFSSTCELISEHDYDFTLNAPIDGSTDPGSNYYNAFNRYAEKHSGEYPCTDVFNDPCLSKYLEQSPEIPDLMLEMTCRSTGFYYSSVGEDPPSEDDGEGDMGGDNGGEGDGEDNGEDGEGDADGSGDGNGDGNGDGKGDGSGPNPTSSTENNKSLTTGGTVAIVLGVLAVVGLVGVVAFFFLKKRKSSHKYQIQLE